MSERPQTTDDDWKDIRPFLPPVGERLTLPGSQSTPTDDDLISAAWEKHQIAALRGDYRYLARAYCRLKGFDPDEVISDAGHECWELVAHDAIREERERD